MSNKDTTKDENLLDSRFHGNDKCWRIRHSCPDFHRDKLQQESRDLICVLNN